MLLGLEIAPERLFFQPTKRDRGRYFVEYRPPVERAPFATLSVSCIESMTPQAVAQAMEGELAHWLRQYPVPILVSAFDPSDRVISIESVRSCDHLVGWLGSNGKTVTSHWRLLRNEELPNGPFEISRLLELYRDTPYTSETTRVRCRHVEASGACVHGELMKRMGTGQYPEGVAPQLAMASMSHS
jgi:hypothetical protein